MEVVLRPINDLFLKEVVFPAFELGVVEAAPAIEHLLRHLVDEETRVMLELVLEHSSSGTFFGMTDDRWNQTVYRLLFHEWVPEGDGWAISKQYMGYAGPWEETFHLSLMLEDADYPYSEDDQSELYRRTFWGQPKKRHGLSTLLCGAWDPVPAFPPDQVLTTEGNGIYDPRNGIARADWAWRPMMTVNSWAAKLPSALNRLLDREVKRLAPLDPPERFEILDFWLGRVKNPPILAVSFSGLGPRAVEWIREIGALGQLVRSAAADQHGLTAVISRGGRTMDNLMDSDG
jgi:hypothetical protein